MGEWLEGRARVPPVGAVIVGVRVETPRRRGLAESLEQYAARCGVTPAEARYAWRVCGLYALGVDHTRAVPAGPRIAPGVAVPTPPPVWLGPSGSLP